MPNDNSSAPTVLLAGRMSTAREALLRELLTTDWNILTWDEDQDVERLIELAPQADVLVGGRFDAATDARAGSLLPTLTNIKLRLVPHTGINWMQPSDAPKGCIVCNAFGHEISIAEYIIAGMLESAIGLRATDARFRAEGWAGRRPGLNPPHGELYEMTVGIVGYGHIGREVAKRAAAFGMRVIAASRTVYEAPELDWFGPMDQLGKLLGESDYVVVTLPLADETEGLFDAVKFAQMKPTAVIVNVGRGLVINEKALFEAIRDQRISGAIIDVWFDYPHEGDVDCRPSKYPFEDFDNVLMTPHCSGSTDPMRRRRWAQVAENLDRFQRGEDPINVCFEGTAE